MHFIDLTREAFMEFTTRIDPVYRGPTINWLEQDKSKIYAQPKFSDRCTANEYTRKYGFTSDTDFKYIKAEIKKLGQTPMEVKNHKILILL